MNEITKKKAQRSDDRLYLQEATWPKTSLVPEIEICIPLLHTTAAGGSEQLCRSTFLKTEALSVYI